MPAKTLDTILSTLAQSPHTMTTAEIVHASGLADRAVHIADTLNSRHAGPTQLIIIHN